MKDKILEVLDKEMDAKSLIDINDMMGLKTSDELKELQDALEELIESNDIYYTNKGKYLLLKNSQTLKIGKLDVNKKGFGFVIMPKEEDIYIPKDNLNGAVNDDIVLAEIVKQGIKREGRIVKIIERELDNLVGEIKYFHDLANIKLDDDKLKLELELDQDSAKGCVEGSKVLLKVVKKLSKTKYLVAVEKVIGHKDDPGVDILSIAYKYKIFPEFGPEVEEQLKAIPNEVEEKELTGRHDLTNKEIFTIDASIIEWDMLIKWGRNKTYFNLWYVNR